MFICGSLPPWPHKKARARLPVIRSYFHSFTARYLTTLAVGLAVDRHPAFKADAHPAKGTPRLAPYRPAKPRDTCDRNRCRNHAPLRNGYGGSVDNQGHLLRHGGTPGTPWRGDRVRSESRTSALTTDPPG